VVRDRGRRHRSFAGEADQDSNLQKPRAATSILRVQGTHPSRESADGDPEDLSSLGGVDPITATHGSQTIDVMTSVD
jgi:hypothetical protein